MTRKLHILLALCCLLAASQAFAQGKLSFEKETHDFGTIAEGTQAVYEFRLKNVGDQPVIITGVQASCGCTTPTWTSAPILPGKMGMVTAVYNSAGRPGAFNKSISVASNAEAPLQVLYIKGEVGPKDLKTNYSPEQKAMSPRLAVGSTNYNFGKLEIGQKSIAKFRIKNTGRQPLVIQGVKSACNCVQYRVSEPALKPGQTALVELRYSATVLGEQSEEVTVLSNDIVVPMLRFTLKANVTKRQAPENMLRKGEQPTP
ncbi:DUF1573 domain-containing protein [Pontibacter sp. E15-1]|uniref:DUF1573 domain-containing protein n=1 Tax=Pontibacter sp. E15-1 TaxID=2919918 RepID=UPI001F4FF9A4|nr:DUF1573 domain-containing protein [Pontibacter sp. E15-1]MCJ8167422.1 DUF1573 domain-containing protein [Pontibacter sp. E15-1]